MTEFVDAAIEFAKDKLDQAMEIWDSFDEDKKKLLQETFEIFENAHNRRYITKGNLIHISYELKGELKHLTYHVKKGVFLND